jgi:hypothetical protein
MATAGRTLQVALVANTKSFRSGMMSAVRDAKTFQGKMSAVATQLRGVLGPAFLAAGAAAGALAVKMGVDGVKAAIADQKTVAVLAQTLENLGQAHRQAGVEEFIANLESATGVADEQLRPALGMLVSATGDVDEAQRRLKQVMDASIFAQADLTAVTKAFQRALATGTAGTLSRYGIIVDENIVKTEGFGAALDQAASQIAGLADAEAKTLEGRLRILSTELDNVKEAFGYGFLNSIGSAEDGVSDMSQKMRDLKEAAGEFGEDLGGLITLTMDVFKAFKTAEESIGSFVDSLGPAADAVALILNPVEKAIFFTKVLAAEVTGNEEALEALAGITPKAAAAVDTFGYQAGAAADEVEDLNEQMGYLDDYVSDITAILNYEESWDALRKSLKENGKQFDFTTKQGQANNRALITFAENTAAAADSQDTLFGKTAYVQDALGNLGNTFEKTKMSDATRAAMLAPFQALIDDLDDAEFDVTTLQAQIDRLKGKDIPITVTTTYVGTPPPGGFKKGQANGGLIRGPGTGTSDSIPSMLSNGEFVVRASSVRKFGSQLFSQLNSGVNPLAGMGSSTAGSGSGLTINGGITVQSAPGERADQSLPRALRRMAFLAGA